MLSKEIVIRRWERPIVKWYWEAEYDEDRKLSFELAKWILLNKDVLTEAMATAWSEAVNAKWESRVRIGILLEELGIEKWGDTWRSVYTLETISFFRWEIAELMRMI